MTYKNDKNISNISFINKDFESLWAEILALIPKLTNKWVPSEANESDPLAVLLKEQAIMTDKINYNVDKNILELFPQSLTQLRSAYDVYNSMGYYPDWYVSATVDLTLSRNGKVLIVENSESSTDNGESLFIDVFTSFSDSESKTVYVTTKAKNLTINESVVVPAIQGTALDFAVDNDRCITTDYLDAQNRIYFAESNVAQNGIFISEFANYSDLRSSDSAWKRVDNLSQELGGQKVYKFGVDAVNNACYIQFPNDIGSLIGSGLYIKYIKSDGVNGNITIKAITQFLNDIVIKNEADNVLVAKDNSSIKINDLFTYTTNLLGATNGKDPMTIDEMNLGYDKVKNVFNTLVTLLDYKNYLYNYKNSDSRNIVSNIQVSDRSNDLYKSYTVKSFDAVNNINVDIIKNNINSDGNIDSTASLTAYNIRFYPLAYSSDVASLGNFNNTFTQITATENIDNAIQEVKSLNHDVLENGSPIILTYDLDGFIYLNDKVSQIDANQIKNKVVQALWIRFNSRQLGFGEMPDYGELVDTIKGADDRISYVALNPITAYKQKEDNTFNQYYSSLDIIKRSIIAGITPWSTRHNDLQVKFGQIYNDLGNNSKLPIKDDINNQPQLQTSCLVREENSTNPGSPVDYTCIIDSTEYDSNTLHIYQNELLSITYPTYRESVVYTNYLYYEYKLLRSFKSGQIYSLQNNESITLYEKKGDTKAYKTLSVKNNKPVYVKLNFDLNKGQSSSMTSIGLNTISEMELVKYDCKYVSRNDNTFIDQYDSLYFSDKQLLKSVLQLTCGNYVIIPTGSYVIRITNDKYGNPLQFEIISEGSTIQLNNNCSSIDTDDANVLLNNYESYQVDLSFLNEYGDLQGISSKSYPICDLIKPIDSTKTAAIILQLNDIQTFGNGCDVYFYDNDNSDVRLNLKSISLSDIVPFTIKSSGQNRSLAYRQSANDDYTYVSFGDLAVTGYYGLCIDNAVSSYQPLYQTVGQLEPLVNGDAYRDIAVYGNYIGVKYTSKSTTSLVLNSISMPIPKDDVIEIYVKDENGGVVLLAKYVGDQITNIRCDKQLTLTANADIQYVSLSDNEFLYIAIEKTQKAVYIKHQQCIYYSKLSTDNTRNYTLLTDYSNLSTNVNLYVSFSKIVSISVQQKLNLTESDTFNVYVYRFNGTYKNTDDYITNSTGVTLPNYGDNKTLPIVIRCVFSDNSVKYILTTTSGDTLNLGSNIRYYQPVLYAVDAKVYTGHNDGTATNVELLNIYNNRADKTKNYVELTTNYLYDAKFDPTYVPTDPINNPADTSTYFNKNHILNRYVIAQLKGYNADGSEATSSDPLPNLKISDLSIIK